MPVKIIRTGLTEQEQGHFQRLKEKIGIQEDYGAIKKCIQIAEDALLFGQFHEVVVQQKAKDIFQRAADFREEVDKLSNQAANQADRQMKLRNKILASGKHNPSYVGGNKEEHDSIGHIDFKREYQAKKAVVSANLSYWLARFEKQDWIGDLDEKLRRSIEERIGMASIIER